MGRCSTSCKENNEHYLGHASLVKMRIVPAEPTDRRFETSSSWLLSFLSFEAFFSISYDCYYHGRNSRAPVYLIAFWLQLDHKVAIWLPIQFLSAADAVALYSDGSNIETHYRSLTNRQLLPPLAFECSMSTNFLTRSRCQVDLFLRELS